MHQALIVVFTFKSFEGFFLICFFPSSVFVVLILSPLFVFFAILCNSRAVLADVAHTLLTSFKSIKHQYSCNSKQVVLLAVFT